MLSRLPNPFPGVARIAAQQDGFAVPTSLLMLMAAMAMVSVGVVASINTQRGTIRDQGTKSALQLAEAGVSEALLHYNRIRASAENPCSPLTSSPPDAQGWCPPISGTDVGGSYSYQVRPSNFNFAMAGTLEIVATGTTSNASGASRRVYISADSASAQQIFSEYGVQTSDGVTLDSNSEIHSSTATNGDIVLSSNARQCGQASVGQANNLILNGNSSYHSDANCTQSGTVNHDEVTLPPVNQGDVATNNDNGRLFGQDLISGSASKVCFNGLKGNGSSGSCGARHLDLQSNTSVTLGGSKYSFCKLTMSSNTAIYIAAGHSVVIYFDSPEACGYPSGTTQLEMDSNARITGTDGSGANAALLFVGSSTLRTKIHLSSNTNISAACEQNFVIYAPLTDIEMDSNSTYCGGLAGRSLHMDSNARVYSSSGAQQFVVPATAAHYTVERFVDCITAPGTPPSSGC
jgi:hypothetical protein